MVNIIHAATGINSISRLVNTIFSGNHDIIIDASVVHTLERHLLYGSFDLNKIDLNLLATGIFFTDAMCAMLPRYKNRLIMFKELKKEYYGRLRPLYELTKRILRKYVFSSNLDRDFKELKKGIQVYDKKLKRLEALFSRAKSSSDSKTDRLTDLIVYLNKKFEWKDISDKTVDEKIIAHTILNAVSGKPTRAYTLDEGILYLSRRFLNLMHANELIHSKDMRPPSRTFLKQLKKADASFWAYSHTDKMFVLKYSNLKINNKKYDVSLNNKSEKRELTKTISEHLFKIYLIK